MSLKSFNIKNNLCKSKNMKKHLIVTCALLMGVFCAATLPQEEHPKPKNLKVLPKNISHDELEKTMKGWSKALGVKCSFCHVSRQDDPKKLDFASDAKPEKDMARSMYKMTMKINKKYFGHEKSHDGQAVLEVSCNTCHRGDKHPAK